MFEPNDTIRFKRRKYLFKTFYQNAEILKVISDNLIVKFFENGKFGLILISILFYINKIILIIKFLVKKLINKVEAELVKKAEQITTSKDLVESSKDLVESPKNKASNSGWNYKISLILKSTMLYSSTIAIIIICCLFTIILLEEVDNKYNKGYKVKMNLKIILFIFNIFFNLRILSNAKILF